MQVSLAAYFAGLYRFILYLPEEKQAGIIEKYD